MRTKILDDWRIAVRRSHMAHHIAAAENSRLHRALGIPVVIMTTVVGTTVFATLGDKPPHVAVSIIAGLLSVAAAVLSSLQTFLSYSASAEKHKLAAVRYGMLRREIEQFIDDPEESPQLLREFMEKFRARWDQLDQESPPLPQKIHDRADKELSRKLQEERGRNGMSNKALQTTGPASGGPGG